MGAIFSKAGPGCRTREHDEDASCKRQKTSLSYYDECERLIPALPDELSMQILARVPRTCYFSLRLVSQKWKATIMNPELYKLRKELGFTEEWLYMLTKLEDNKLLWYALDPFSKTWQRLPLMPKFVCPEDSRKASSGLWLWNVVGPSLRIAEAVRNWLGKKQSLDDMPFCGSAIGVVDGCLYVLGGFFGASTMRSVWRFDPIQNEWTEMTSMSTARAYCKTGLLNNKLYVVGGVSRGREGLSPLQSAEVFDPCTGSWSEVPSMPFSKAQMMPTAFLNDMLKPIATGMTSYMGRLCVPQSLYAWPFIVDVGGEIYNPETNSWDEMPSGMAEGWPARQAGTKLSAVVDGRLYAFDPSSSHDSGKVKVYSEGEDAWKVVTGKIPIYDSADVESPYLLAGFHKKIHVITKDANHCTVVMQADLKDGSSSLAASSTASHSANSPDELLAQPGESETVIWKLIASRDFGSAELVSCQVLEI